MNFRRAISIANGKLEYFAADQSLFFHSNGSNVQNISGGSPAHLVVLLVMNRIWLTLIGSEMIFIVLANARFVVSAIAVSKLFFTFPAIDVRFISTSEMAGGRKETSSITSSECKWLAKEIEILWISCGCRSDRAKRSTRVTIDRSVTCRRQAFVSFL